MNSLRAKLLVATPLLPDDNFHRTVVLLIEHNEDGALGVVLNRPRQGGGAEAVAHWADRLQPPGLLHEGGPVSANSVIGLARGPDHGPEGLVPLYADIGVLDLHRDPDDLPDIGSVRRRSNRPSSPTVLSPRPRSSACPTRSRGRASMRTSS